MTIFSGVLLQLNDDVIHFFFIFVVTKRKINKKGTVVKGTCTIWYLIFDDKYRVKDYQELYG